MAPVTTLTVFRVLRSVSLGMGLVLFLGWLTAAKVHARGDEAGEQAVPNPALRQVQVDPHDFAAASSMADVHVHILPARTEAAQDVPLYKRRMMEHLFCCNIRCRRRVTESRCFA